MHNSFDWLTLAFDEISDVEELLALVHLEFSNIELVETNQTDQNAPRRNCKYTTVVIDPRKRNSTAAWFQSLIATAIAL
ncbi:hypothetical protein VNO80_09273 [Phaseolus coccineus]|uniref:Uncharacterized protein n=1 Tax=Phaseolus coccineus TaxID=3886 RepID=A0AAN9RDJ0_PHACN